jgi:hypothetical protein
MARTLGIDIGSNSIGWAVVEDGRTIEAGCTIYPVGHMDHTPRRFALPSFSAEQAARFSLLLLALGAGAVALFFSPQFWGSVAFSALVGWLSLFKR